MKQDSVNELLFEAQSPYLKKFNSIKTDELDVLVDKIRKEMEDLELEMTQVIDERGEQDIPREMSKKYMFLKSTADFYERIVKAYKFSRIRKIQESIMKNEEIADELTKDEALHSEFFTEIFTEFKNNYSEFDFMSTYVPTQHFVHFITLEDCGVVMDGDEMFELKSDRYFYMKKSVIKHLIGTDMIKIL